MPLSEFIVRILVALALGLLLGLDREIKHAPVGVRTFALVAVGSALYTILTLELGDISAERVDLSVDPSRLIQGLIGGIGFLGAGAIIGSTSGNHVRGIATGAAIWVSGGVGVACGLGLYWHAAIVTVICAGILLMSEFAQVKWGYREELDRQEVIEKDED